MRFLVIGGGSAGQRHAKNLREMGHGVTIYDEDPTRTELARRPSLADIGDGTLVCTPPDTHLGYAAKFSSTRKPVFVEKPLSDHKTISGVWNQCFDGRLIMPATNYRFHPDIQRLKAAIDSGELGEIIDVRAEYAQDAAEWGATYERDWWLEAGIHLVDYCWWLAAPLEHPWYAEGSHSRKFYCLGKDDCGVSVYVNWKTPGYHHRIEVFGSQGSTCAHIWPGGTDTRQMYVDQMRHFIACIEGREQPICTIGEAVKILEVTLAAGG